MASMTKLIRIQIKLQDDMSKELDKSADKLKKLGQNMTTLGRNMTFGITAPIVGLGTAMFKTFADYDAVMTELQARTQSSAEEMEILGDKAIEMGRLTMFGAKDAAEAMLELTASGASAAETLEMIDEVLDLAAAGSLELGQSADSVTDIMKMFQLTVDDTRDIVDALAKASGSSSATVQDLTDAFEWSGTVAKQYGMTVEETAAALAVLAENGIKSSRAGTALRSMLTNMNRDTEGVANAWIELGTSMYDAQGNMRNIDDVFKDINAAMANMTVEEQNRITQELAGTYGMLAFNSLRAANGISDMQGSMAGASDAATIADAKMNSLAGRWEEMMGSLETLAIVLGDLGEGPLTDLIAWVTKAINAFTEWASANPKLAQALMLVVAAIAALGPIVWILGSIVTAVSTLMPLFGALAAVVGAVSLPVLALVAALGALAVGLHKLTASDGAWAQNFRNLGTIFQELGNRGKNALGDLARGVTRLRADGTSLFATFEDGSSMLGGFFNSLGMGKQKAYQLGETLNNIAKAVLDFAIKFAKQQEKWKQIGSAIVSGLMIGIKNKMKELVVMLSKLALEAIAAVQSAFKIRSPSKVMMEMGEQVVAGFNQGIESMGGIGVNVPQLGGAGSGSASPSLGVSGSGIYINNLNVPAGTTTEQVDAILKELGKRVKRQGGRVI